MADIVKLNHDRLAVRKALAVNERFIVSPVFPTSAIHLVVGDSGIGKSTWFLESLLYPWSQGISVLGGLTSHPCKWVYVSMDRSLHDTNRTLQRLGLGEWNIPAYSIEELCQRDEQNQLVAPTILRIHELFPDVELIALEGLQVLTPNTGRGQTQNKAESLWLMELRDKVLNKGVTVIATEHIPKGTDVNNLRTKRNSALGSAALIGGCGTIVSFDYPMHAKQAKTHHYTDERVVHLSGHNFAPYTLTYDRGDNGSFILQAARSGVEVSSFETPDEELVQMDSQLSAWDFERSLTSGDIHLWGRVSGMGESAVNRWTKEQVLGGRLELIKRGEYKKLRSI